MTGAISYLQSGSIINDCKYFPPACIANISDLTNLIVPLIFLVSTLVLLGVLIFAGFRIITAGHDQEALQTAKRTITFAIIGILFIFLSFFLVRLVSSLLGVDFLL